MDDSWVEADRGSDDESNFHASSRFKTAGRAARSPEPEFVMPHLDADTLGASWAAEQRPSPSRSPKKASASTRKRLPKRMQTPSPEPYSQRFPKKRSALKEPAANHLETVLGHIASMAGHGLDILARALKLLKAPLSMVVAAILLFQIGIVLRGFLVSSFYSTMSPLCAIPGSSLLNLPFCPSSGPGYDGPVPPAEFDQLMSVQSKFDDVLRETAVGATLPSDMKRSEATIRDLRQLVRYSSLHSKNELGLEFDGFVDTARIASFDLQRFNSHVGRAVDQVLSTTRWTVKVLDDLREEDTSRGSVNVFISDKILAPFRSQKFTEAKILDQYVKHTAIVEEEIHKLIGEAQAILMILTNLEDRLEVIHSIVLRDKDHVDVKKDEILAELWTILGGNRGKLSKMNNQLDLLHQVTTYRTTAYVHVSLTIVKLQEISSGLEDLRERVGAPGVLRDRHDIPLSVHLDSIQRGVERLEESRERERINVDRIRNEQYQGMAIEAGSR